jgi:hypothetical protein
MSRFHNHKITSLLRVLTLTVAARYAAAPAAPAEQDDLEVPGQKSTLHAVMDGVEAKLEALGTSDWMLCVSSSSIWLNWIYEYP